MDRRVSSGFCGGVERRAWGRSCEVLRTKARCSYGIWLVTCLLALSFMLSACGGQDRDSVSQHARWTDGQGKGQENSGAALPSYVVVTDPAVLSAAVGPSGGGAPGIQQIRQRGTLIVAMYYEDRPPYFYVDDAGRLVGSDVEMALDIAAKLGVDVAFLRTARSFDEVIAQVARGEADVGISKLSATLARAEHVLFTEPYLVLHQALLVNRLQFARLKLNEDEMLAELQNTRVKIGVKAKTSYEGYVREMFPQAEVVRIGEEDDVMAAAARGDVLAAFYDELEVKRFIYDNPSMAIDLKVLVLEDRPDPLAMAVAPENIQLLGWLNLYLRLYQQELSVDSLLRHYGPVGVRP